MREQKNAKTDIAGIILLAAAGLFTVISLCMMPGMRCRAVMKPGAAVFSSIIIVFALLDIAMPVNARKRDTKRASL